MRTIDLIGWIGVLLILIAFILTTFGAIDAKNTAYGVMNFVGALGIATSSYVKRDFQPVVLNSIWLVVAGVGIVLGLI